MIILENGCSKIKRLRGELETIKILILSSDKNSINLLRKKSYDQYNNLNKIEIYDISSTNEAIMLAEERHFDIILFDYSLSNNTFIFLQYLTLVNSLTKNTVKIILTDRFNHIDETTRINLLKFAHKVISKTASYFNIDNIVEGSLQQG